MSDIRALWRSALRASVPECQKSKTVGWTWMAKCNQFQLTSLPFKGLTRFNGTVSFISMPILVAIIHGNHNVVES